MMKVISIWVLYLLINTNPAFCQNPASDIQHNLSPIICHDDTFRFNDHLYYKTGKYIDSLKTDSGVSIVTINLTVSPLPIISLPKDTSVTSDDTAGIQLDAGFHEEYLWTPSGETTRTITIKDRGKYYLQVKDNHGCIAKDSINVGFRYICYRIVNQIITPNGDGMNDIYKIHNPDLICLTLIIYNRYGKLIHQTSDPEGNWDGKQNGKMCPDGAYYYVIEYEKPEGNPIFLKGAINLITSEVR